VHEWRKIIFSLCRGQKCVFVVESKMIHSDNTLSCTFWKMQMRSQFMQLDLNTSSTDDCVFVILRFVCWGAEQEGIQDCSERLLVFPLHFD
jgi:hypothetical protein